jgi:hypothetical protein
MSGSAGWIAMTKLAFAIAATHDHWFEEPTARHAIPAVRLWWRHFSKHHPIFADAFEWSACGVVGVAMLAGALIANA